MSRVLSRSTAFLSMLGAAFLSAPAFATDFSEGADFGGTYSISDLAWPLSLTSMSM